VLGEVDVFQIEPDHELYGHMNVNYLKLDRVPRYDESWGPILKALRDGRFFVTTGEVLITDFMIGGQSSRVSTAIQKKTIVQLKLTLRWTFPLAHAQLVSGDGTSTRSQKIDLSHTGSFGEETLYFPVESDGQRWSRLEVRNIATNGAFTQPIWLH
jgi:hypothetical protein